MIAPGAISLWMEQADPGQALDPLAGDSLADVVIVGGGFTGLWTAYYLKTLAPELDICVLEARRCGFGASGRNGGWMMAALEGETRLLAALDGERRSRVAALIHSILPEVERVLERHGIDCGYHRGGGIYAAARYPEQLSLQRKLLDAYRAAGFGADDFRWLNATELASRLRIAGGLGGIYTPHIARIQPAELVLGLVRTLRGLGVRIFEQTPVSGLEPGQVLTATGRVKAPCTLLALEGYSAGLPEVKGRVLAVQSRIIATEPLSESTWSDIGLDGREVFCDASPLITYGQRSADNRMVFGARGTYRFGGAPQSEFGRQQGEFGEVQRLLCACFPQLESTPITHRWGGTLGAPRNGFAHSVYDPATGLGTAGGYFGEGVGAANLMARTLADQVLGRDSELVRAPWALAGSIDSQLRRWEPEPLRWLGYKATDLVRRAQESVYRRQAPDWQKRPVQLAGDWLERQLT
jgi:glycine/D-amino acid oxidase-like deaminating enzyme